MKKPRRHQPFIGERTQMEVAGRTNGAAAAAMALVLMINGVGIELIDFERRSAPSRQARNWLAILTPGRSYRPLAGAAKGEDPAHQRRAREASSGDDDRPKLKGTIQDA